MQEQQEQQTQTTIDTADHPQTAKDDVKTMRAKTRNEFKLDLISLILAFILIILFVISGVFLTATGHDTVGGIIFSTTIIGVAGLFITGAYNKTQKP